MITVALPTWKNEDILWLPLEGLVRQKCNVPWELIIMECESDCSELIRGYKRKLKKAGCVSVRYIFSPQRTPLLVKWKMMAEIAKGDVFCLQASDDYPQPDRNQKAWDGLQDNDWFHSRYFYQYSLKYHKLIKYDKETFTETWKTGYNISILTKHVCAVQETQQLRCIDAYLYKEIKPQRIFYDESSPVGGVSTDGRNTLSTNRHTYYTKTRPPFVATPLGLHEIGLPKGVVERIELVSLPEIGGIKINKTGKLVSVVLKRAFNGRRVGREYMVDEGVRDYMRFRGVLCENGEQAKVKIDTL